ncbi:hypothetical protein CDD81_2716 [Ophiocordyceps australis]|uniref:Uncharacterized protein n=1 Tax=Ophiocordyceps australis TaxID=1399860 RepID=A0A2C5YE94_9HYPO|nr:hypothetical protein CDD81_2716 [Ophiocordyceps australis]
MGSSRRGREQRSPSTFLHGEAPQAETMRHGDERFRVVEDEFLATAQRFTTHLHRAEYTRLKAHAHAVGEIARPVVGPDSTWMRVRRGFAARRHQGHHAAALADSGLKRPWMSTSLSGLMETPAQAMSWASPLNSHASSACRPGRSAESRPHGRSIETESVAAPDTNPYEPAMGNQDAQDYQDDTHDPFGIYRRRAQRLKAKQQLQHGRKDMMRRQHSFQDKTPPSL